MNSYFSCAHRVKFDLFRKYHNIAAAGDRHLAEFMPGDTYLLNPETIKQWKFSLTPVSYRKEDLKRRLARSGRLYRDEEHIELKSTGEEGVQLIKALCGLGNMVSNVNLPNYAGQIANLDKNAVVETNALFSFDSVAPVYSGNLPEDIKELILPHVINHERVYRATVDKDRSLLYQAFENDPIINHRLTSQQVKDLVDEMLENTSKYNDL